MSWRLVVPPATTPVTVAEARYREHIISVDPEEDPFIQSQLSAATRFAEEFTRRAFVFQTWELRTTNIRRVIEIPRPPLIRIIPNSEDATSMVFTDLQNNITPIEDDKWHIDNVNEPGHLIFWPYNYWPSGYLTLKFECGYGPDTPASVDNVPQEIKEGILQLFGFIYQNREGQPIPCGTVAHTMLSPFKVDYL